MVNRGNNSFNFLNFLDWKPNVREIEAAQRLKSRDCGLARLLSMPKWHHRRNQFLLNAA